MKAKRPGQSPLLLLDVVDVLAREGIDYAVVGALAAAVYGAIRASADADALVSLTVGRLSRLAKLFEKEGFRVELRRGDPEDPIPAMLIIGDKHQNRVDLLCGLRGLDPQTLSRTLEVPFGGATLRFVSREDFIAMKCFAGGPQDLEDARIALKTAEQIDLDLLRKVARRFGRASADALETLLT